jgi:hypothetical protein
MGTGTGTTVPVQYTVYKGNILPRLQFVAAIDLEALVHDGVEVALPNIGRNLTKTTKTSSYMFMGHWR